MTKQEMKISRENHKKAAECFNLQSGYVLHHIDESLRHNNIERYILWLPEDLVVMSKEEHSQLHKIGEKNPMYGKHHTEEELKMMSRNKPIEQYTKTGEFVARYISRKEAFAETGVAQSSICRCANGKLKSAGGFIWKEGLAV